MTDSFAELGAAGQSIYAQGQEIDTVTDLHGKTVNTSPQLRQLHKVANGADNIIFAQHWLNSDEMSDPFGPHAAPVRAFDPITSLTAAKAAFERSLEDEIYGFQHTAGLEETGQIPADCALVLFSYNLVELGTRPTFLYVTPDRTEPFVWSSAIEYSQVYDDLMGYLIQSSD